MIYLLASIGCSIAVSAVFKANEEKRGDRWALLAVNYAVATACAVAILALDSESTVSWELLVRPLAVDGSGITGLTLLTGALFIGTYFVLAWATRVAGMGLATGVMRVSVVLPVLASWLVWHEVPTVGQTAALILGSVAFFCIADRPAEGEDRVTGEAAPSGRLDSDVLGRSAAGWIRTSGVLLLLFVSGGVVDTCIKAFDEWYAAGVSDTLFLTAVYFVATLLGTILVLVRRIVHGGWPTGAVWARGGLLGLLNYSATLFFLRAVRRLEGPFVFPANSIAIVVGAALVGVYAWNERLTRANRVGLALAVVALLLLPF